MITTERVYFSGVAYHGAHTFALQNLAANDFFLQKLWGAQFLFYKSRGIEFFYTLKIPANLPISKKCWQLPNLEFLIGPKVCKLQ